ncbi:hypothetical protein CXB51_016525 [Gossypium anomalum]|uniref:Uncharacterized protein n=1 Tax=Gossypium anomalum TaxID=47600 RepID=A0A8J5YFX0_9ROSI|nr:hypothetical protein CXB51_016525 [Gossypium anomalum]
MKVIAAFLLAVLGGNTNPSADDLKAILGSVGAEADDDKIEMLLSEVKGKDITELIASGREKLASVPSGGGGVAVAAPTTGGGAGDASAAEAKKEEKVEEKEESDDVIISISEIELYPFPLLVWLLLMISFLDAGYGFQPLRLSKYCKYQRLLICS